MCEGWFDALELVVTASYVHSPVFRQDLCRVHTPDGQALTVPLHQYSCCRDVVFAVLNLLGHTAKHASEWALYEQRGKQP